MPISSIGQRTDAGKWRYGYSFNVTVIAGDSCGLPVPARNALVWPDAKAPVRSPLAGSVLLSQGSRAASSDPAAWQLIEPLNGKGLKTADCEGKWLYFHGRILEPNDVVGIALSPPPR